MALEILDGLVVHGVHHDLESVYWVLVWIILRHTVHTLSMEDARAVFVFGRDSASYSAKDYWIQKQVDRFDIPGNKPLVKLLRDMAMLVIQQVPAKLNSKSTPMTHDAVIQLFNDALDSPGWPEADMFPCKWLNQSNPSVPGVMHDFCAKPIPSPPSKKIASGAPRSDAERMPPPADTPASYRDRLRSRGQRSGSTAASASATPSHVQSGSSSSSRKRKAEEPVEPQAQAQASGSGRSRGSKRSRGSRQSEHTK